MNKDLDLIAEWILYWYGEIEWHRYSGLTLAYPHPRALAAWSARAR